MTAYVIDGKKIAHEMRLSIQTKIAERQAKGLRAPGLAVILVGSDPASTVYVRNKRLACEEVGITSYVHQLSEATDERTLTNLIERLNHDPLVDGILLQLPLPEPSITHALLELINPQKDVDGFHPYNLGRLAQRRPLLRPCTPFGIMQLLTAYAIDPKGANVTIVGASNIVGRPMALEFLQAGATVTVCHQFTKDLAAHIQHADILVSAIGKPGIIKTTWLRAGVIAIDVGISRDANGSLRGDLDYATAQLVAQGITPVPGGVGPMTIVSLLQNTLQACERAVS